MQFKNEGVFFGKEGLLESLRLREALPSTNTLLTTFKYSTALKGKGGNWTEANLDKWIKSPADYAPGNSMAFAGVANAKDRADLVAYLKTKTA